MTNQHPITPPPELVDQWYNACHKQGKPYEPFTRYMTTRAAQWGADMELEACCEWLQDPDLNVDTYKLRAARRPKPPSLKEQALAVVENALFCDHLSSQDETILRRAIEALPND